MNIENIRRPKKLELGKNYIFCFGFWNKKQYNVRFIKVTPKGYNFLNLETSKCLLKHHLYPSKCVNHIEKGETWFWINTRFKLNDLEVK